jgi:hypothetical protein
VVGAPNDHPKRPLPVADLLNAAWGELGGVPPGRPAGVPA